MRVIAVLRHSLTALIGAVYRLLKETAVTLASVTRIETAGFA
jgi:hypothetical protein